MKQIKTLIIILIAVILLAIGALYMFKNTRDSGKENALNSEIGSDGFIQTQSSDEGEVKVSVLPKLSDNTIEFKITLDTHSVNLDYDMASLAELIDDSGIIYKASGWQGDPPGGHHREGVLKFDFTNPAPKSFILKIKKVGGVRERVFKW